MSARPHKVVCISMYLDDLAKAKAIVAELKKIGYTKANVSWLLRTALHQFDRSKLPPPYTY